MVVADDSISVRKFVGRMLEKAGYRVRLASDGLEAAEIIAEAGCNLVITDLEMPRMNGYELMAHLRQDTSTWEIPGPGGHIARRSEASRPGGEGRRRRIPDEASAGRATALRGGESGRFPHAGRGNLPKISRCGATKMATAATKKIRVLIVDDSAFMCKVLQELIHSDPQLEAVGHAHDGREAVGLAESLQPDVITMDIEMPHVDGLQAIEIIMSQNPRPIVVVSSGAQKGADATQRALQLGAIDCIPKPSGAIDLDMQTIREELNRTVKRAAKVRVIRTASSAGLAGKPLHGSS